MSRAPEIDGVVREVVLAFVYRVRTSTYIPQSRRKDNTGVKVNTSIFDQFEKGGALGIPLKTRKIFRAFGAIPNLENHKGGTL